MSGTGVRVGVCWLLQPLQAQEQRPGGLLLSAGHRAHTSLSVGHQPALLFLLFARALGFCLNLSTSLNKFSYCQNNLGTGLAARDIELPRHTHNWLVLTCLQAAWPTLFSTMRGETRERQRAHG